MHGCYFIVSHSELNCNEIWYWAILVAEWSKEWVCGRLVFGTAGSNPAGDMFVVSEECV